MEVAVIKVGSGARHGYARRRFSPRGRRRQHSNNSGGEAGQFTMKYLEGNRGVPQTRSNSRGHYSKREKHHRWPWHAAHKGGSYMGLPEGSSPERAETAGAEEGLALRQLFMLERRRKTI